MSEKISPVALSLAALSVEYCKRAANCESDEPRKFLCDVLRFLPRFYIVLSDLDPYGNGADEPVEETGAIYSSLTEEQYDGVRNTIAGLLGENDVYLEASAEDMRFSDTPVAVSLSERLADIYQNMADYAAVIGQCVPELVPDVLADIKYRFASYLSDVLCSALKAADYIYHNANFDAE